MSVLTNDTADLTPRVSFDPPMLTFDFPGLRIGAAEYEEGPTGCTVFHFARTATCAVDVRGGSVGSIGNFGAVDAICLAGGSLYGLEAATGVAAELWARRGYSRDWGDIALVNGAIVFDLRRENSVYPDKALGRAALREAREGIFPLGRRGAGRNTQCGGGGASLGAQPEKAGQGGAFRQIGPTKLAVFTVVNALGALVDRQGRVVRGHRDPASGERASYATLIERKLADGVGEAPPHGNTTLTVLVTNQKVGRLDQLGKQVHASMARAIQPFHTEFDGDILYAVSTGEVENPDLGDIALGVLASELAWDAVLSCVQDGDGTREMRGRPEVPIYFYSHTEGPYRDFSNFSPHGVDLDGLWWPTVEHYFQAQKFPGTEHAERIRRAGSPRAAKTLGRSHADPLRSDWDEVKDAVMRRAVLRKFELHAELRELLLSTGEEDLVENAPSDYYWGCGRDGSGKNMLGTILMEVRDTLRRRAAE